MRLERSSLLGGMVLGLVLGQGALAAPAPPPVQPGSAASPLGGVLPPEQPQLTAPFIKSKEPPPVPQGGPTVTVGTIDIVGNTVYPKADLAAMFSPLIKGPVPRSQIIDTVRQLQLKYREDGYFLTKVAGTLDATSNGGTVLKVYIIEGYISSVKLAASVGPASTLVYGYLKHLEGVKPLRLKDLERYILLAQNVPGITLRTILRAAKEEPGAVELIAQLERKPYTMYFADDNRGPRTAGPNELLTGVTFNSYTDLGERLDIAMFNSAFDKEEIFGQVSFQAFVGTEGWKVSAYTGYGVLEPGDVLRSSQYKSRLLLNGVGAEYPLVRSRAWSLYLNYNFDFEQTIIDLLDFTPDVPHQRSNDNLRVVRSGMRLDMQDSLFGTSRLAANEIKLQAHQGLPFIFDGTTANDPNISRPGERPDFTKLTAEIQRTQTLYSWNVSSLALYVAATGQYTNAVLPPAEKQYLGGSEYGRGFYYGEITGDDAVGGTVELQLNDTLDGAVFGHGLHLGLQYYGFYDTGQVWNLGVGELDHHIESGGVGVRATLGQSLSFQVEGVERFTRQPQGGPGSDLTALEPEHVLLFRVAAQI
jgi:hemolysin activation/secretion protein